jgi:hypothetical protein
MLDENFLEAQEELRIIEDVLHANKKSMMKIIDFRFGGRSVPDHFSKKLPEAVAKLDDKRRWIFTLQNLGDQNRKLRLRREELREMLRPLLKKRGRPKNDQID